MKARHRRGRLKLFDLLLDVIVQVVAVKDLWMGGGKGGSATAVKVRASWRATGYHAAELKDVLGTHRRVVVVVLDVQVQDVHRCPVVGLARPEICTQTRSGRARASLRGRRMGHGR